MWYNPFFSISYNISALFVYTLKNHVLCPVNEENLIFGTRAVIEALEAGKEIEKILLQKGLSNELYHQLRNALKGQNIPLQFVPPEKLKRLTDLPDGKAGSG